MHDLLWLVLACLSGIAIGGMFFGGLWWTVRYGLPSRHPALWILSSAVLRTGFALAGLYVVGRNDWRKMLAALVGFILARTIVMWRTRAPGERQGAPGKRHAS